MVSWLTRNESTQRLIVQRTLDGEHPTSPPHIMDWLKDTAEGRHAQQVPGSIEHGIGGMLWMAVGLPAVACVTSRRTIVAQTRHGA